MVNWLRRRGAGVVLLGTVLLAAACDGRGPTTPTPPPAPPPPPPPSTGGIPSPPPPSLPRPSMAFEMTGVVTDDKGTPVPGAKVVIQFDFEAGPSVLTDGSGRYSVRFASTRGANAGPAGTELSVAMALIEAPGYDWYARYLIAPTEQFVENFHLRRIHRITAGESAVVTVEPGSRVCGGDWSPGRETMCGTIHVVAPADGTLTVEAVPADSGSALHGLEVYDNRVGGRGNPVSIRVTAGSEYTADLSLPWGFTASRSFVVKTSIAGLMR